MVEMAATNNGFKEALRYAQRAIRNAERRNKAYWLEHLSDALEWANDELEMMNRAKTERHYGLPTD
jgi:hypothetical protein